MYALFEIFLKSWENSGIIQPRHPLQETSMTTATPQQPGRDLDTQETREWMDALSAVIEKEGPERAHFLLEQLLEEARGEA